VGITLTAARYLVRLQRPWSLVDDKQVNDRVHRIGSEIHDSVILLDYVVTDTVQAAIVDALDNKKMSFEEVVQDRGQILEFLQMGDKK
jgi:SNF2 family DNA or RNA helicase